MKKILEKMKSLGVTNEELSLTYAGSDTRSKEQSAALLWRSIDLKAVSASEKRKRISSFVGLLIKQEA